MSNVLFQDGDWRICSSLVYNTSTRKSTIHHRCSDRVHDALARTAPNGEWWCAAGETYCSWCKLRIPDEIKGLWLLHEWDR